MTKTLGLLVVVCIAFMMGFKGPQTTIPDSQIESAIKERLAMDGRINSKGRGEGQPWNGDLERSHRNDT